MRPIVVVETRPFQRFAAEIWSEAERQEFIDGVAREPTRGAVMQGTGGVRKLRWSREGTGKSGGVRVIYYFHDEEAPLFLLTVYAKGRKDNLTADERNAIKQAVTELKRQIREARERGRHGRKAQHRRRDT
jgi:hypothetical protein